MSPPSSLAAYLPTSQLESHQAQSLCVEEIGEAELYRNSSLFRRSMVGALAAGEVARTADRILSINRHAPGVVNTLAVTTAARLLCPSTEFGHRWSSQIKRRSQLENVSTNLNAVDTYLCFDRC